MRVLVIAAHMDDETIGPGGAVVRHVERGDDVIACVAAKRAYDHRFVPEEIEAERACCQRAGEVLGYREIRYLDLRDELLDERLLDVIVPLEAVVAELRPDVVYTHHRGDLNQDHRAVFQASMIACRPLAPRPAPRLISYEALSSTDQMPALPELAFHPNLWVRLSDADLDRKKAALACYERELRPFPHPRSLEGLEVLARRRGMEIGERAAEAFLVLRDVWW